MTLGLMTKYVPTGTLIFDRAPLSPPLLSCFKRDNVYTELHQNLLSFLGYAIWNDLSDKKRYVKAVLAFEYLKK